MKFIVSLFLILGVLFQYQLWFGQNSVIVLWQLKNKVQEQSIKNTYLKKTNVLLAQDIKELQSNTIQIETIARSELGLIKKGEEFYQLFN